MWPVIAASAVSALGGWIGSEWLSKKEAHSQIQPGTTTTYHAPYERYEPTQIYAPSVSSQRTYTTIIESPKAKASTSLETDLTSRPSIETTKKEAPQTQNITKPSAGSDIMTVILPLAVIGGGVYLLGKVIDE